uniref:Mitochondrial fission regulator n=1 Tax=Oncorhynchus mykiss TaxID=8022 RepID=A0A8C7NGZ4_ONCMY
VVRNHKPMCKAYGSSRSIVRRIATNLPLKPCPRVHFQLNLYTEDCSVLNSAGRRNGLVASLADVVWIDREDENDWFGFGRLRSEAPSLLMFRSHPPQPKQQPLPRRRSLPSLHQGQTRSNDEAIQKISALEMELAKLGAQIAQVVLTQEQNAQTPGGPPAPGAPPPPPLMGFQRSFSVVDLIQEHRWNKTDGQTLLDQEPKQAEVPNMLDVLKDIGKVKLRPAKRWAPCSEPTDAASLIANALKRKFAHRYRHDNENKEFDFPASEFPKTDKVEVPLFGQHMLKSTGQRKLL